MGTWTFGRAGRLSERAGRKGVRGSMSRFKCRIWALGFTVSDLGFRVTIKTDSDI